MRTEEKRTPAIFLAMPVYRGWDFLDETITSVLNQEFQDFRLLMSIDGGDERSAEICAKYTNDSRLKLVVQPKRLGWATNLNWLIDQCDGEYFSYWQQDDLCATSFLSTLYPYAVQHPEAACAYADVQWFGNQSEHLHLASVTGPALARVSSLIENGYAEIMGLIRHSALKGAGPLRTNAYDSRLEDYVWAAKLAREGELHYVPGTLYYKRAHATNTHSFQACPADWNRGIWIEYGIGLLEAGLPVASGSERVSLLLRVLERLIVSRPGRWMTFEVAPEEPGDLACFANEFLDTAVKRLGVEEWKQIGRLPEPQALRDALAPDSDPSAGCDAKDCDRILLGLGLRALEVRGETLAGQLAESEADREARLEQINVLGKQLEESEADRAKRLQRIEVLTDAESKLDRVRASIIFRLLRSLGLWSWLDKTISGELSPAVGESATQPAESTDPIIDEIRPLFDVAFYLRQNPEAGQSGQSPYRHYLNDGAKQQKNPHPLFDTAFYLKQNRDIDFEAVNPLLHFLRFGASEGRDPHPLFRSSYYLDRYPEVAELRLNPLLHYLNHGAAEGRSPNAMFDSGYYLRGNPEVQDAKLNPLVHFVEIGAKEGRNPHPAFDIRLYIKDHPELRDSGLNPLVHYFDQARPRGPNRAKSATAAREEIAQKPNLAR